MQFGGIQLTTTLDYPGEIATILFTKGCNLKCGFCHNAGIASWQGSVYYEDDIMNKLLKRKNIIDHIVITGGEPSLHGQELIQFMRRLKNEGFKIKLDTNGTNPEFVYDVIRFRLVDYIAMDIKTILSKNEYSKVSGILIDDSVIDKIKLSLNLIINTFDGGKEFRTTVVKTYHSKDILFKLADYCLPNHYFQQFVISDNIFDKTLEKYTDNELRDIVNEIITTGGYHNIHLRGI